MYTTGELHAASTTELWIEFRKCVGTTVESVRYTAMVYRELVDRGEDMAEWDTYWLRFMMPVAKGTLLPELVVKFGGRKTLMELVAVLPMPAQKMLTGDGKVDVVHRSDTGGFLTHSMFPLRMTPAQVYQVFGDKRIRTVEEQTALLEKAAASGGNGKSASANGGRKANPFNAADDDRALFQLLKFTPTQKRIFLEKAHKKGMTACAYGNWEYVRRGVIPAASPSTEAKRKKDEAEKVVKATKRPTLRPRTKRPEAEQRASA
jgi:hypothetical protein